LVNYSRSAQRAKEVAKSIAQEFGVKTAAFKADVADYSQVKDIVAGKWYCPIYGHGRCLVYGQVVSAVMVRSRLSLLPSKHLQFVFHPVTGAVDGEDGGVVQQAVENRPG